MSDNIPVSHTGLGLGDCNIDPEILTKAVDHDFFDDPPARLCQLPTTTTGEPKEPTVNVNVNQAEAKASGSAAFPDSKESFQLFQRRESVESAVEEDGGASSYQPMSTSDNSLDDDKSESDSSANSYSDLEDSSESELESLKSEDEEFVDMLEKYFDYVDPETDCSDLTEVSPLSSLTASPLPTFATEEARDMGAVMMLAEMNLGGDKVLDFQDNEILGVSSTAVDLAYNRPEVNKTGLARSDNKPQLPIFISTTESIIVPEEPLAAKERDSNSKEEEEKVALAQAASPLGLNDSQGAKKMFNANALQATGDLPNSVVQQKDPFDSVGGWSLHSSTPTGNTSSASGVSSSGSGSTRSSGSGSWGGSSSSRSKRTPKNYTFTPDQMRKIERENHILLRKILDVNGRNHHFHPHNHRHKNSHAHHSHHGHSHRPATSSARLRQQKRIELENTVLVKRIQNAKPSKEIEDAFTKPPVKN